jgi:uncharacterized protein YjbI with pentapeptide repeats
MANDDHIAQLKLGVASWNAWRGKNPQVPVDLAAADLRRADLRHANLSDARLSS